MSINKIADARPHRQLTPRDQNFMKHGPGHDTETPAPRRDPAPTTRTTVVIPADLHRDFKAKCVRNGTTMGAEIVGMMRAWVGD